MSRILKILLVLSVALWGLIGALGNFTHWNETLESVRAVTSMATFEGGINSWKATSNPAIVVSGALFILLSKVLTGLLCLGGAWQMWKMRMSDIAVFTQAKTLALTGCTVAVFMLFFGFIVIAESWFELWRSDVLRGPVLNSAFRYAGIIGLVALIVGSRED